MSISEIIPNQQNGLFADSVGRKAMLAVLPGSPLCQDLFSEWEVKGLCWRTKFIIHYFSLP